MQRRTVIPPRVNEGLPELNSIEGLSSLERKAACQRDGKPDLDFQGKSCRDVYSGWCLLTIGADTTRQRRVRRLARYLCSPKRVCFYCGMKRSSNLVPPAPGSPPSAGMRDGFTRPGAPQQTSFSAARCRPPAHGRVLDAKLLEVGAVPAWDRSSTFSSRVDSAP